MGAPEVAPVVLKLISIHDPAVRYAVQRPEADERSCNADSRDAIRNASLMRNRVADAVTAELDVQTAVVQPRLVDHCGRYDSGPTQAEVLTKHRDVVRISY